MTYIDLGGPGNIFFISFHHFRFEEQSIFETYAFPGCVGMNYLSQKEGISVNVSYGENLLHSQHVKPPNPEPICMSLLINLVEVCARFVSLVPSEDGLKGCLVLESKVFGDVQTQFDIGCFNSGPYGMKLDQSQNSTSILEIPQIEPSLNGTR